jgi:formate hydrogenlyase subunit 3/multisubunit Na+/H+ antiporter MnhD subunit
MSPMMLSILIILSGGLFSLVLFRKAKKLQWIIFFMSTAYLTAVTLSLYGKWELAETFRTGFFNLHLANTKLGWLFLAASTIVTLLISIFSLSYNDKKHATGIAPL